MKHVGMSQSATPATPATRNKATRRWTCSKFCKTYHRHGHSDLTRTVADGCERRRTVGQRLAHTAQAPNPQSETGTLATSGTDLIIDRIGNNGYRWSLVWSRQVGLEKDNCQPRNDGRVSAMFGSQAGIDKQEIDPHHGIARHIFWHIL